LPCGPVCVTPNPMTHSSPCVCASMVGLEKPVIQILKSGLFYFVLVFAAGFALGTIRTLWIVPRMKIGARAAELIEAPIMVTVSLVAAGWVVRRLDVPFQLSSRLGMGCAALGLMLLAEFTLVLRMRKLSLAQYLAARDPVSGTVYYVALAFFAIMPMLVARS
jgi:hypothetical protein